jgi:hypothetical protein
MRYINIFMEIHQKMSSHIHDNIIVICDSNLELDNEKSIYNQDLEINGQRMSNESNLDWKKDNQFMFKN